MSESARNLRITVLLNVKERARIDAYRRYAPRLPGMSDAIRSLALEALDRRAAEAQERIVERLKAPEPLPPCVVPASEVAR